MKTIPAERLQLAAVAPRQYAAMFALERSIGLEHSLRDLIKIRASQLNGCAFCIDMHWKDARAAGESEERLYLLAAWRDSALYSDRERAALALCEALTQPSRSATEEQWDDARAEFDEQELADILFQIAAINAWNRLMIGSGAQPGHYEPGDFAPRRQ